MFLTLNIDVLSLFLPAARYSLNSETSIKPQNLTAEALNPWMLAFLIITIITAVIFIFKPTLNISGIISSIKAKISKKGFGEITGDPLLDAAINAAGYSYDKRQDIFYSNLNAWQRNMGYCRMYDEAAAPMGMIIDCEPIHFEYGGKRWLIELWKGQYDLTTGCEVGIYTTEKPDINIPGIFKGPFYESAGNSDLLKISYYLQKGKKIIFARNDTHWWITGFKLGEFSEPSELIMHLNITLKDREMLIAFMGGLMNAGYKKEEILVKKTTVNLIFKSPKTPQPSTRTEGTDNIIQRKNKVLCQAYSEITKPYNTFPEKIKAVREQSPELYMKLLKMFKHTNILYSFEKVKDYLS